MGSVGQKQHPVTHEHGSWASAGTQHSGQKPRRLSQTELALNAACVVVLSVTRAAPDPEPAAGSVKRR